jgi:AcrR family transcriptional regulator
MGKIDINKKQKKESLLNTAFSLFTSKGFQNTSISDIVTNAGVAKGTFYLYFTDKYDIRNKLIAHKANTLFLDAYDAVCQAQIADFEEQIIYITGYIIDRLDEDKSLLNFISKHLSWGVFRNSLTSVQDSEDRNARTVLMELLEHSGCEFREPEVMFYMIIELVCGAIYNPILHEQPVTLDAIKPYIFESVRAQIRMHMIPKEAL